MVIVWIRHFTKAYSNGKSPLFPLDPPVLPDPEGQIPQLRTTLVTTYGSPDHIICSPYLRCRETAAALTELPPHIDTRVSEYLSARRAYPPPTEGLVRAETALYNLPHNEDSAALTQRVQSLLRWLEVEPSERVIWVVTHGSVIRAVSKEFGHRYYPRPLEAVVMTPTLVIHSPPPRCTPPEDPDVGSPATTSLQSCSEFPPTPHLHPVAPELTS